jgi:two-component system, NarL family, nitrate/nitrite response regulator NarL
MKHSERKTHLEGGEGEAPSGAHVRGSAALAVARAARTARNIGVLVAAGDERVYNAIQIANERRNRGWTVSSCPNPRDIIYHILNERPAAVLLDTDLHNGSVAFASRIRFVAPNARMVIHTVRLDSMGVWAAIAGGAAGYVVKPAQTDEIVSALSRVIEGGYFFSPSAQEVILTGIAHMGAFAQSNLLSQRELQVLACISQEHGRERPSAMLGISDGTLHAHLNRIFRKLQVHNRRDAVRCFLSYMACGGGTHNTLATTTLTMPPKTSAGADGMHFQPCPTNSPPESLCEY